MNGEWKQRQNDLKIMINSKSPSITEQSIIGLSYEGLDSRPWWFELEPDLLSRYTVLTELQFLQLGGLLLGERKGQLTASVGIMGSSHVKVWMPDISRNADATRNVNNLSSFAHLASGACNCSSQMCWEGGLKPLCSKDGNAWHARCKMVSRVPLKALATLSCSWVSFGKRED